VVLGPTLPIPPPPPTITKPIRPGGDIRPPAKTRHVAPIYPAIARQNGVQGTVMLEAVINEAGRVRDVRVLRSIPLLDAAAIEAVKQWQFTPTLLNGQPVPVLMTVTVAFQLK
jgi:protein TonB